MDQSENLHFSATHIFQLWLHPVYVAKQDKCYAIATVLNVDPGWLMTGEEPIDKEGWEPNLQRFASDPVKKQSREARIISEGIDRMNPARREQALKVLQAIFTDIFDGSDDNGT